MMTRIEAAGTPREGIAMKLRMFSSVLGSLFVATALPACVMAQSWNAADDPAYSQSYASQPYAPGTQAVDPPGRVIRVDLVDGSAALRPAGEDSWVGDVVNRPLASGDQVWVENNSRAELHVGATAVRLGARTALAVVAVDDNQVQLRLNAGSAVVRVRTLGADERFEVQTPMYTAALRAAGEYRFDVNDAGNLTLVAVRAGQADVYAGSRYYSVGAGQRGAFDGDAGSAEIDPLAGSDALDLWADERDAREDNSQAARYVSRDVTGYEALDGYGTWVSEPDYGYLWMPTVSVGWTPFSYGHWVYVSPWGWTWIDDAPWGFAPSHYGRWVSLGGRWGWMPGPRAVARPVYAPAMVAWIGNPGPGRVGWMPLGPRDVYVPPYRVSDGYARRVNQSNAPVQAAVIDDYYRSRSNLDRPRVYAHQGVAGAIVTVNQDAFASARPVQKNLQPFNGRSVQVGVPAAGFAAPRPTERSFGRPVNQPPRDVPALVQRSANTPLQRPAQAPQVQPPQQSGERGPVLQQRDRPPVQRPAPAWQPPARVEQPRVEQPQPRAEQPRFERPRVDQPPVQLQQPRIQQPERPQQPERAQQAQPQQQRPQPQQPQQQQKQQPQRPQPQGGMIQREVKKDKDRERE